ncbi:MAG TPA: phosphoribosylanthranilate isomerase [Nitrospira sp.]|nr:phosphoribosylanthranilate isomerase [Nitrospira sp.]
MRQSVKVKVCGITNAEDAWTAVEAGADALGFIFYKQSPRYVVPAVASRIIAELPPLIVTVGVFVNEGMATVRSIMDTCGLAMAQLHGDENASYCHELSRPSMKALRLKDRGSLLALAEYQGRGGVRGFVLDTFSELAYGGTGQVTDWALAADVAKSARVLLAGGLTPDNVTEAIRTVHPYGVDVNSGVESAPGKKDPAKVRAFLEAVRVVSSL